ncbi:homoserine kinase [Beijerinckia indica]|uniref:Homoserine kinase n=1 Tax=Beijerinckia indica subsp. indica (strain ATCC 9039 / DSM 1715 / NCIMB 8712) TaxID=395963 RepID=KHSE_BEII9|nr:homoserine kinase [Beijerinckia indica]B2IHG2.1 RecName: Full=Homoserine kinase; Short=HK; Short=HSK [Beijerinckia indica subsp. indica ATCC 9039]ACB95947.1 homoserine kinase [Beijerinckia indica subsp. indica ATCC 9039]
MAVYTHISETDLKTFLASYDIGNALVLKGIAEGVENSNFFLQTERGFFILTLYEKRVEEKDLPFFLGLMEHLSRRGLNCPQPVHNRSGHALGRLAGRPAVIVTFLEGVGADVADARRCAAVGEALARLHQAGADFAGKRTNALGLAAWRPLFETVRDRADTVAPALAATIAEELDFLEAHWPRALPQGVIHADLFPDNVLFRGETLSGLIDFYFACVDAYAYDIAICLNAWCFEPDLTFNIGKGLAFFTGYEHVRKLTAEEAAALPVLARGGALRFALTRLVDWLNVPKGAMVNPKDPLEYMGKLAFHQTVGTVRELGLLR